MTQRVIEYLSTQEVADKVGIHLNNVSRLCRLGRIKGAVQVGGRWLIPKDSVAEIKTYPQRRINKYK